jgi:hypothetical protein
MVTAAHDVVAYLGSELVDCVDRVRLTSDGRVQRRVAARVRHVDVVRFWITDDVFTVVVGDACRLRAD